MRGQRIANAILTSLLHDPKPFDGALQHAPEPIPGHLGITVPWIIDYFGLDFGVYIYDGLEPKPRAEQYVRNAIAQAIDAGELIKVKDSKGRLLRHEGAAVYRLAGWGAPWGYEAA